MTRIALSAPRLALALMGALSLTTLACTEAIEQGEVGVTPSPDVEVVDSGPEVTPIDRLKVDTGVSDDGPLAGEVVTVFCTVEGLGPDQPAPETQWALITSPEDVKHAPEITGNTVVFKTAGVYRVQCSITETKWTDPTAVTVVVEPGIAGTVDTTVSPNTIGAGSTADVFCEASDAYDNPIVEGWDLIVGPGGPTAGPAGGLIASALKVKGLVEGTYEVACRRGLGTADDTPAVVTVEHGLPNKIVTTLDDESIVAGGETKVSCHAEDKQGNVVPDLPMTISLPDVMALVGLNVSSTVAGTFVVRCVPAGLDWNAFILEGAVLQVVPGPPVTLELALQPPKPFFATLELVTLLAQAQDEFGNGIPDADITVVQVSPTTDFNATSLKTFLFKEDGTYTMSTSLANNPGVTASIEVAINGDPPAVTVTYPLRGATLSASKPSVTVEGLAQDSIAGIAEVRVNGSPAQLNADGSFTNIIIPRWGMNLVEVEAEDGSGTVTTVTQSFYFSDHWYPLTPGIPYVPDAIKLWMSEDFIDDGVHNPTHPDDLATILEGVLKDLDLTGALGTGSEIGLGYSLELKSINFNPPKLSLDPQFGGMDVDVEIKNLYVSLKLKGECKVLGVDLCPDFSGSVSVDKTTVKAKLLAEATEGDMNVSLTSPSVDMDHIDVDVNGILGWLFDWLIDFFVTIFSSSIEDLVEDQVGDALGDTLTSLFTSLAISETFELPALLPGMAPIVMTLDAVLWTMRFTPDGGEIGMAARMLTAKNTPHDVLGTIGRGTCIKGYPTQYGLPGDNEFEVGLYDDLLNQILSAAWYSGALNVEVDETALGGEDGFSLEGLPIDSLLVTTDFFLPPIINGCGDDGLVKLQLGDFFLDAEIDSVIFGGVGNIGVYLFVEVNAEIYLTETDEGPAIGLILHDVETLKYHWEYVPEAFIGSEGLLETLINSQLIDPLLQDLIGSPLTEFPIPSLNMSDVTGALGGGAGGSDLTIVPQVDNLVRDNGHTVLKGALE